MVVAGPQPNGGVTEPTSGGTLLLGKKKKKRRKKEKKNVDLVLITNSMTLRNFLILAAVRIR